MAAWRHTGGVLIVAALALVAAPPVAAGEGIRPYLRGVQLPPDVIASVTRGAVEVRLLGTSGESDVAALGIVRVPASQEAVMSYFLDLDRSLGLPEDRFGLLRNPPQPEDVAPISIDASEYRELQDCRPGKCHFKLSAAGMSGFAQQIDWSAPDAKAQVDRRLRREILQAAREYRSRGDSEILSYDDKVPVRPHDLFPELATQMSRWLEYPPELRHYLTGYPAGRPGGTRDELYWIDARLPKIRPTLVLNHLVAYASPGAGKAAFIATKQLYASHYLDGALELIAVVNGEPGAPGTYLLAVRLLRFDQLPRGPLNIRGKVEGRLQETLTQDLVRYRSDLESAAVR